ncbi:MarR family winged helix-turn-helix transcriptional regulator [Chthonobacter rhizosphaerae]|uniref:MarR family winged helix-turn-helix transcriptional regulator n=1 Tax=Chthonobacter rhizosphaerae TaxID=2735553 RepID=UPI0015EE767D|nr:MarR family winged helix-turn-helix transcriptional regulator [Chthonobacter rhizosphaerae]
MTQRPDPIATAFTHPASALAVEVFRLNGALVAAGDRLVAPLGLTSARWQVLGGIARDGTDKTVPQVARTMGLARQSVQRIVDDLVRDGLVALADNPHHKRARLVRLTPAGTRAFADAMAAWRPVADQLVAGFSDAETAAALALLRRMRARLDGEPGEIRLGDEPGEIRLDGEPGDRETTP